jgi:hypothetical protein
MSRCIQPRAIVVWLLFAASAGAVLGVAARVAMRLVALQAGIPSEFSLGGSIEIVLFGAILGAPVALAFWACRRYWRLPAGSGVLLTLGLFAILALWPTPAARGALAATNDAPAVTAVIFGAAFVVYGVALEMLWRFIPSRVSS